jgi:signal transduction histidine kinase
MTQLISHRVRHTLIALFALLSLSLIIWSTTAVIWNPCRDLVNPMPMAGCPPFSQDISFIIVALGLWIIGLAIWLASRHHRQRTFIFLFACHVSASLLAINKLPFIGIDRDVQLFFLLVAWITPLVPHYHLTVLDGPPSRASRFTLMALYASACLWTPIIFMSPAALQPVGGLNFWRFGVRIVYALSLVLTVGLLAWEYVRYAATPTRRRIRLVAAGAGFAFAPMLILSLLPELLDAPLQISFDITIPLTLLAPLTYGYALFRDRMAYVDIVIRRAAVYYLLVTLLLGCYLAIYPLLDPFFAQSNERWLLVGLFISVGLLLIPPIQRTIRRAMNWVWYGSDISYDGVVGQLAEALALTLERSTLRYLLIEKLPSVMGLSGSALFLRDDDTLTPVGIAGITSNGPVTALPIHGRLMTLLEQSGKIMSAAAVRHTLDGAQLSPSEQALLIQAESAYWLPLVSGGALQGLLIIGARPQGDFFTDEDRRILATLAHQAGTAAHNVRLTEEVNAGRRELARAHQQLLVSRERERRRLAQKLHDDAVQNLLAIALRLANTRQRVVGEPLRSPDQDELTTTLADSRQEILFVVRQLRQQIGELRPAGLDELGLTASLDGFVAQLRREYGPMLPVITLDLDQSGTMLPEPTAICLFRVAQEATRNALKHAHAQRIDISLRINACDVMLRVSDDGCGFSVPARLSKLTRVRRFGLVGMAEQVKWAGGSLVIHAQPGTGTDVTAHVPIRSEENDYGRDYSGVAGG